MEVTSNDKYKFSVWFSVSGFRLNSLPWRALEIKRGERSQARYFTTRNEADAAYREHIERCDSVGRWPIHGYVHVSIRQRKSAAEMKAERGRLFPCDTNMVAVMTYHGNPSGPGPVRKQCLPKIGD